MKQNTFPVKALLTTAILFAISSIASAAATSIPIKVVAFGGKVTITNPSGKSITPAKDAIVSVGSAISTGPNSWIDLAQGGVSTMRVKAKTQSFTITSSSFDGTTQKVNSLFKLKNGAIYLRVNKKALLKGSKYQVQMPEVIAGVIGSEGEIDHGPHGVTIHNVNGGWAGINPSTGNSTAIPPGNSMTDPAGPAGPSVAPTPPAAAQALDATNDTIPTPSGDAVDGTANGGTAAGETPSADAIGACSDAGVTSPAADDSTTEAPDDTEAEPTGEEASPSSP